MIKCHANAMSSMSCTFLLKMSRTCGIMTVPNHTTVAADDLASTTFSAFDARLSAATEAPHADTWACRTEELNAVRHVPSSDPCKAVNITINTCCYLEVTNMNFGVPAPMIQCQPHVSNKLDMQDSIAFQ